MLAAGSLNELFTQAAHKDVDDLELGFLHPAIEMVEEHLLGQSLALVPAQQLEDAIFLAGQMRRSAFDLDLAGAEIDDELIAPC
jgi:hypothetical protein